MSNSSIRTITSWCYDHPRTIIKSTIALAAIITAIIVLPFLMLKLIFCAIVGIDAYVSIPKTYKNEERKLLKKEILERYKKDKEIEERERREEQLKLPKLLEFYKEQGILDSEGKEIKPDKTLEVNFDALGLNLDESGEYNCMNTKKIITMREVAQCVVEEINKKILNEDRRRELMREFEYPGFVLDIEKKRRIPLDLGDMPLIMYRNLGNPSSDSKIPKEMSEEEFFNSLWLYKIVNALVSKRYLFAFIRSPIATDGLFRNSMILQA